MLANTHKQNLSHHLFSIGYLSKLIIKKLYGNNLQDHAFLAGLLHDVGKIDDNFQKFVNGKSKSISFEKHLRHNEISLVLMSYAIINEKDYDLIANSVYYHHPSIYRKDKITKVIELIDRIGNFDTLIKNFENLITDINKIIESYDESLPLLTFNNIDEINESLHIPEYKTYIKREQLKNYDSSILKNAKKSILRAVLITVDHYVSSLSADELKFDVENKNLDKHIDKILSTNNDLTNELQKILNKFPNNERSKKQKIISNELSDKGFGHNINIKVLSGPAGCGKTKIALEYAKNIQSKKIIWICPRVQICQSLYNEFKSEQYSSSLKIELVTGDLKYTYDNGNEFETNDNELFSGDIILTTIDQMISTITTHKITNLIKYLESTIIFDEYHEYVQMTGMNIIFGELLKIKKIQKEEYANVLLVSATINPVFVSEFLHIDSADIHYMESFNDKEYKITFNEFDEGDSVFHHKRDGKCFVISNTATDAQIGFIKNQDENSVLIHSKYKNSDKLYLFDKVFKAFKKNGTNDIDILRSGPIMQASFNVSTDHMITEITSPENILQRLGRTNRFGLSETAIFEIYKPTNFGNSNSGNFLSNLKVYNTSKAFFDYLKKECDDTITINDLYKIYNTFYKENEFKEVIHDEILSNIKAGVDKINENIFAPKEYFNKKQNIEVKAVSKHSLRGNNVFVNAAIIEITNDGKIEEKNEYVDDVLTDSIDGITGYGKSEENLIPHFKKYHKEIFNITIPKLDGQVINDARKFDNPIYLSYTEEHRLNRNGLGDIPIKENCTYYVISNKQPIGMIKYEKLKKFLDI